MSKLGKYEDEKKWRSGTACWTGVNHRFGGAPLKFVLDIRKAVLQIVVRICEIIGFHQGRDVALAVVYLPHVSSGHGPFVVSALTELSQGPGTIFRFVN